MKRILFFCSVLLVIAGCSQRSAQQEYVHQWTETEARLYDIPLPQNAQPDYRYVDTSGGLAYFCSLDRDELVSWYCQQLDISGWVYSCHFMGPETIIRGKKPKKWCSISIRPSTKKLNHIVIFTGPRGLYHKAF